MSASQPALLVNYWYAHAVGHAVEGLRYCQGYRAANPDLHIGLLLNGASAPEMAGCCSAMDAFYPVAFTGFLDEESDPYAALAKVPSDWDYVMVNHRATDPGHQQFAGFRRFFAACEDYFRARVSAGKCGGAPPAYLPNQQLRLTLPQPARAAASATLRGRRAVSVVLSGGSAGRELYPSVASWELVLSELSRRYPDAALCLIGKLADDGRTSSAITRAELNRLLDACPAAVDCFDRPLLDQLALMQASDLFLSPHSGIGFAAVAVGTPWLTLSGGHWHEMFFNGVPFYSVLPDTRRYPCFAWGGPMPVIAEDSDGEGPRTASMSASRIREDLPELLDGARLLIDGELSYEQAHELYWPRLLNAYAGDRSRLFSFDGAHRAYI